MTDYNYGDIEIVDIPKVHNFVDMTGMKIASLEVVGYAGSWNKSAQWWCLCDCGRYTKVSRAGLNSTLKGRASGTRSCGCVRKTGKGSRPDYLSRNKYGTKEAGKRRAFGRYKGSAKQRGLEISLTLDEFDNLVQQNCHYCNLEPSLLTYSESIHQENIPYIHSGIDRKDNNLGYTKENSLPCCSICNHAKHVLGYEDFINWVAKVYEFSAKPGGPNGMTEALL